MHLRTSGATGLPGICNLYFREATGVVCAREEPTMNRLWQDAIDLIDGMGTQEWMLVLVGVIVLGFFCMRGFGSRSNY